MSIIPSTPPSLVLLPTGPGQPKTQVFSNQRVAVGREVPYGPFAVVEGSRFEAAIGGPGASGDPDLYVRFGVPPTTTAYNCRPYLASAVETCALDVPSGQTEAFVMVQGYTAARYRLTVKHVVPATP